MVALTDALGQEFGDAKMFRPYRDVRFAKAKSTVLATRTGSLTPGHFTLLQVY